MPVPIDERFFQPSLASLNSYMAGIKQIKFADLDLTFSAHPVSGQPKVLKDTDAIEQSVRNLVLTNYYETFYNPDVGANLRAGQFELFSPQNSMIVKREIRRALENDEPRVRVLDVRVSTRRDHNEMWATIVFQPRNMASPVSVDVFLARVR